MVAEQGVQALLETSIQNALPEDAVQEILSSEPFIPIPQALNFRTIFSSPHLKPNLIFRSGSLEHLPPSSLAMLKTDYNITTVFDLRSQSERETSPSPLIDGVETVWIPSRNDIEQTRLVDGTAAVKEKKKAPWAAFVEDDGTKGFVNMYGKMLETHKPAFKAVFEKLRDGGNGGLLFHCTGMCFTPSLLPIFLRLKALNPNGRILLMQARSVNSWQRPHWGSRRSHSRNSRCPKRCHSP
jgi:hypothetical protein